jgi:hypothetical protein
MIFSEICSKYKTNLVAFIKKIPDLYRGFLYIEKHFAIYAKICYNFVHKAIYIIEIPHKSGKLNLPHQMADKNKNERSLHKCQTTQSHI